MNHFQPFAGPFSDEALGQRSAEAIAQDERQAADEATFNHDTRDCIVCHERIAPNYGVCFACHTLAEARYHAALVVIANEEGAGRYARAINLVAKIWGKTTHEVMSDAVSL